MNAASWDHGYHSASTYTSGFYRELSPSWLDFAALLKGHAPPRDAEGDPFVFLDLGCGTGFGLVMLAALYPEGRFYGVDFHPDHVAHGLDLARRAGVTNVEIIEADFLDLASSVAKPPWGTAQCHYVAAHGIATWVTEPVQHALLALAASSLLPGGLFYCSYNTYPGWLARSSFQKLFAMESGNAGAADPGALFFKAAGLLNQLLGEESQPSALGASLPGLRRELQIVDFSPVDYLCGEFANAGWAPLYFTDMEARCQAHKLFFLGTATLAEAFVELLPPSLKEVVLSEPRPESRELLIDLATNKGFRRDLRVKGHVHLTRHEWTQRLAAIGLRLQAPPDEWMAAPTETLDFRVSFGQIQGDPQAYGSLIEAISTSPTTIHSLLNSSERPLNELAIMLSLLLDAGFIGFDRGPAGGKAAPIVQRFNQLLLERLQEGRPYTQLALPGVGSGLPFSVPEALIHKACREGLEGPMLGSCVLLWLNELGVQLLGGDNQVIAESHQQLERIQAIAEAFVNKKQPMLVRLGALADGRVSQPRSDRSRSKAPGRKGA